MGTRSAPGFVNLHCPIMGTPIDPGKVPAELTRDYKGKKVAFCCAGCPGAWDELTEAAKDAKLAQAASAGQEGERHEAPSHEH